MENILVLGGHGFIGSHTCNILKKQGHHIGVVDCYHHYHIFKDNEYIPVCMQRQSHAQADQVFAGRIEDEQFMEKVFDKFKPTVVIHLATYPNAYMVKHNVVDATNNMVVATAVILNLCVKYNVRRFVFSSSSLVYGDFEYTPDEAHPRNPMTLYGSYKLQGENMCKIWNREHGLNYTIMRPSALYGTRDMIVRVIGKMAWSVLNTGKMTVQGNNKLDFSWVDDVADAFARVAVNPLCDNQIFNCTRGNGRTILEAAELIQKYLGGEIITDDHDGFYPKRGSLNSDKLKSITEWNPTVDIEDGVPAYVNWLVQQPYAKTIQS